jgi:hypothetical protein
MSAKEQNKPPKTKADFQTKLLAFSFMLLIFLLVTLLMPRSGTIGIILQTSAGLIFIIEQIWGKIIKHEDLETLKNKINDSSFQDKIPIIAIPLISPLILVMYFKFGTDSKWYNAFFSILMAVAISSYVYLFFITIISKFIKKFNNSRNTFARYSSYRPFLWSNLLILSVSFIAFIMEILLIYPLSQILHGHSIVIALPTAAYFTLLMFTSYAFLLSFMYFFLFGLFKLGYLISKIHLDMKESDKIFTRRLRWLFLIVFWTWGGILLIMNS